MASPIVIAILANASQANATLDQTSGLMGKVGRAGKLMALGAGVGLLALGKATAGFVADAREAEKVAANTRAVIKATGGAAGVTAGHVDTLASRLSKLTGVDDEAIASGANLLLTFKNVKKEGGIFDRATASALDLSAAGFGSVESASKTLGKALNDPIKGVSALAKQGVTFSDVQKEQIANFVKTGAVAKAQALILGEVESQVGGQAAAQATAGDRLKVVIGNIREDIGAKLIPILDTAAAYLADKLPGWIATAGRAFATVREFVAPVIATVREFVTGLTDGSGQASGKFSEFAAFVGTALGTVRAVFQDTVSIITSLWNRFGSDITSYLSAALTNAMAILDGAFTIIRGIFQTVSALLRGDWSGVWDGIKTILSGALKVIVGVIKQSLNVMRTAFSVALSAIGGIVSGAFNGLKDAAVGGASRLVTYVGGVPRRLLSSLGNLATLLFSAGSDLLKGLIGGVKYMARAVVNAVKGVVGGAIRGAKNLLGIASPSKVFHGFGVNTVQGLVDGIDSQSGALSRTLLGVSSTVAGTNLTMGGVDLKGKALTADAGYLGGPVTVNNTYNVSVAFDNTMTEAQMGAAYDQAIKVAKRQGLVLV